MPTPDSFHIPGYVILQKAGEGGMSTVWTARQESLDRVVALKVLSFDAARDPEAMSRFQMEARAAAKLRHPGIVQIYDAGEYNGIAYYTMEYVPGCTVSELLELRGNLSEKHALSIAVGVADALQYAWETAHIIHCDIKPDNVMIERDGTLKVADLGLALVVGSLAAKYRDGDIMGTPNYISPEQVRGDRDLDCRADIYALGAMLYHILTGRLPFAGQAPTQILKQQVSGYLPDPQDVNPEISSGCAWLLEKMMVKDRTQRYASWEDVLADIEEVKAGGFPLSEKPRAGQSTILRSDKRAAKPPKPALEARRTHHGETPAQPRHRIVLPAEMRQKIRARQVPVGRVSDTQQALLLVGVLLVLVIAGYGTLSYFLLEPGPAEATSDAALVQALPPRSFVPGRAAARPAPALPARVPARTPQAPPSAASAPAPRLAAPDVVKWDNPTFKEGADAFNRALELYSGFKANGNNQAGLTAVEQECRKALAAFEAVRSQAPPDVDIAQYMHQCYQLIADCRQAALVTPGRDRSAPRIAARASIAPGAGGSEPLALSPFWDNQITRQNRMVTDLQELLSPYGQDAVDLDPDPGLAILEQIMYLMNLKDACTLLGVRPPTRKPVSNPAFPNNSFGYCEVKGDFGNGFDSMLLVCDTADRVAAVQLCNSAPPDDLWLDPPLYDEKWSAYDFVQGRTKGSSKWKVAHSIQKFPGVVRLDSELAAHDDQAYYGLGKPKARASLYLPQQIVNLILHRIEKSGPGQGVAVEQ
ncbi:MAG: serine/threonine protein kinase [Kiritimatiellae bacterium]|nr:serine/threonine protein kinase [Kiritimatiellia bacterium]